MKKHFLFLIIALLFGSGSAFSATSVQEGGTYEGEATVVNFGAGLDGSLSNGVYTVIPTASAEAGGVFTTLSATGNTTLGDAVGDVTAITGTITEAMAKAADSAATNKAMAFTVTTPVDTTGTNSHYGIDVALTIGNATGGTNAARGINIANVTGDAQVDVTGINIGTGTTLGTSKAIIVGSGWDAGLEIASPVSITSTITGDGGDALFGFLRSQVASTTTTITVAQAGVSFVSNSTDVMTLPEASTVLGGRYTFVCGTADDFDINPADATDVIGTVASITGANTTTVLAPAAGDAIRCTDLGSSITLEAVGADLWASIGTANGIWTDVN